MISVTKVYIVDDHQMLIDGLKALLNGEPTISIIGESNSSKHALIQILNLHPTIVLTDINMPEMDGIELTKEIKNKTIYNVFYTFSDDEAAEKELHT